MAQGWESWAEEAERELCKSLSFTPSNDDCDDFDPESA
jgi:hypothetical protein